MMFEFVPFSEFWGVVWWQCQCFFIQGNKFNFKFPIFICICFVIWILEGSHDNFFEVLFEGGNFLGISQNWLKKNSSSNLFSNLMEIENVLQFLLFLGLSLTTISFCSGIFIGFLSFESFKISLFDVKS